MVLVDTTVWVDFFAGLVAPHVQALESFIVEKEDLCLCGVVLTEVLQGIRNEKDYERTKSCLETLIYLPMTQETFVKAADLYRFLRRKGITIRKPVDCMIASVAMQHDIPLLHNDRDFHPIAKHCGLKVAVFRAKPGTSSSQPRGSG